MKLADMERAAVATCEAFGCDNYSFIYGKKHPKIEVRRGSSHRRIPFSGSPSCNFADQKLSRDLRAALKELGYVEVSQEGV